jgi:anti-sigma B factor antagonist
MSEFGLMPEHLKIERTADGDRLVLALYGELDLASAPALKSELHDAESNGFSHLVTDRSELEFMDSTGIALLIRAQRTANENRKTFSLRRGPAQVQRVLELTGALERVTFDN